MKFTKKQFIEYILIICVASLLTYWIGKDIDMVKSGIEKFFSLLTPFFIGFTLAYLLNKPVGFFERKLKIKRGLVIAGVYITFILVIGSGITLLMPSLVDNVSSFIDDTSQRANDLPALIENLNLGPYEDIIYDQASKITEVLSNFTNALLKNLFDALVGVTTTVFNLILGIIVSIYMLSDKEKLKKTLKDFAKAILREKRTHQFLSFLTEVDQIFSHFLTGLVIEAIIVGILAGIGFSIMGVHYAPILGLIICITNMIPYFGAFIGAIPAIVTALMFDPIKAIWVALFIIVLQQVDGNVIGPRVMGNYIGLEPIWILLAIAIGGNFGGIIGMILAIPLGAVVKLLLVAFVKKRNGDSDQALGDIIVQEAKTTQEENQGQS